MRRFFYLVLTIILCTLTLTGCGSRGSPYANFRDVADLQSVQTLGYDRSGGEVTLSVSSGRGTEDLPAVILRGSGQSISGAMESMQDYSAREDLFFAHIRYVVVGEGAARAGLGELLDWFERTPQTRLDIPLFIVEGGDAAVLFEHSDEEQEVTSLLLSLRRDAARRGVSVCYTLTDVARQLSEQGCALCCSIRAVPSRGHVLTAEEGMSALESGFAVLRGDALNRFTGEEAARGLCLLLDRAGLSRWELPDGQGGHATVELQRSHTTQEMTLDDDGVPTVDIALTARAGILEVDSEMDGRALHEALDTALAEEITEELRAALTVIGESGADLLGWLPAAERSNARHSRDTDFPRGLRATLTVDAKMERSYDLGVAENLHGEAE